MDERPATDGKVWRFESVQGRQLRDRLTVGRLILDQSIAVRIRVPQPIRRVRLMVGYPAFTRATRGSIPPRGTKLLPLRLAGRASAFGADRPGSNPGGATNLHFPP